MEWYVYVNVKPTGRQYVVLNISYVASSVAKFGFVGAHDTLVRVVGRNGRTEYDWK